MEKNISQVEQAASLFIGGLALAQTLMGDKKLSTRLALGTLAGSLLFRGSTGHCPAYQAMKIDRSAGREPQAVSFNKSVVINKSISHVREFLDQQETHLGRLKKTADGYEISHEGMVWNLTLEEDLMSRTVMRSHFITHANSMGFPRLVVKAGEKAMKPLVDLGLRKIKALIETGEIATIEGQPHGERSSLGKAIEGAKHTLIEQTAKLTSMPNADLFLGKGNSQRKEANA